MNKDNKLAKDWYHETFKELQHLVNQHFQISQLAPDHADLPDLAARVRRVSACCEIWKAVASRNVKQKFFKGG